LCFLQGKDEGGAAAAKEELKNVPALDKMAGEIVEERYDDEDDTLDAGRLHHLLFLSVCCCSEVALFYCGPCSTCRDPVRQFTLSDSAFRLCCRSAVRHDQTIRPALFWFTSFDTSVLGCPVAADFKAEAISGDTKVLNEDGKPMPLPKK
jgi:hypothetical protein